MTKPTILEIAAALLFGVAGCGDSSGNSSLRPGSDAHVEISDGNSCNVVVESQPNGGHQHVSDCTPVTYPSNPPSSGPHYPDWAKYQTYAAPVPWGFLVHDLEHGAIDIVYNCADGCPDEVAQAQALIDGLAPDPGCSGSRMKIVLAPDPSLGVRWAASAWTWTLRASCFDPQTFASFIAAYYQGPDTEAACGGGVDLSVSGWCP